MPDKETHPNLLDIKKPLIIKFLNCFEQGAPNFQHDKVDTFADGTWPGSNARTLQITISYGLVETGLLPQFIKDYVSLNAKFSEDFEPYLAILGKKTLAKNNSFIALLKRAAQDSIYTGLLEQYYEKYYYSKGLKWFNDNGFSTPLGLAIVEDSFLHSGGMLDFLRNRFPETPKDGDEKYFTAYLKVRRDWLKNHSDETLRKLWTRPQFYLDLANSGDWNLENSEYRPNSIKIINI